MRFAKYLVLSTLLTAMAPALKAQEPVGRHVISVGWGVNFPIGGESQFLNKTNYISPSIGYEYRISSAFSVGIKVGYVYSREKGETRDRYDGDLVDGYSDRKQTLLPVQAELRYFIPTGAGARFNPFVSVAGGAQYASWFVTGGDSGPISTSESAKWSYVINPGIGVRIFPGSRGLFHIDVMADWQYAANRWPLLNVGSTQFIGVKVNAGVRF